MEQDKVVNRVLRDLKLQGLISEDANGEVKIYLNAIWVASLEERTRELSAHNEKRVIQYNEEGVKIAEYGSIAEASKKTKYGITGLYSAVLRGTLTKKGHIWKYAENGNDKDNKVSIDDGHASRMEDSS